MDRVTRTAWSLLIMFLLTSQLGLSQLTSISDDFEGSGTITAWDGDDCNVNSSYSNPFQDASNGSATVLQYEDYGGTWANVRFTNQEKYDLQTGTTFSFKLYVPSANLTGNAPLQVSLKLQNADLGEPWITQSEIIKSIVLNQWQTMTFDFSSGQHINFDPNSPAPDTRADFDRVLIQINGEGNNDQVTAYIDDFLYDGLIGYDPNQSADPYSELVWSDEFDGSGAIDGIKWHHQTQLPIGGGWYNGEVQHYTDELTNSYQASGNLHIVAKKENYTDQGFTKAYTSARLNSKFAFTYGRVEVRAILPEGGGTWPAIWMLGKNINEDGGYWDAQYGVSNWPACGEIDIMEHWGWNQNHVSSALHTPSSYGGTVNVGGLVASDVSNQYHVYGMIWDEDKIRFTVDGQVHYTYEPEVQDDNTWPFYQEQYILLNVAIEGSISASFLESDMVIDYVRVYQEPSACFGDINGDNLVNVDDFLMLNSAYGSTCNGCPEDLNLDQVINVDDFLDLNSQFGTVCQ